MASKHFQVVEVSPRDGLQNEAVPFTTRTKVLLIEACVAAGVDRIEAVSFVHPRLVPQMADAEAVFEALSPEARSRAVGLVLNRRGLERARSAGIEEVNVVVAATEGFAEANQGTSRPALIEEACSIIEDARSAGLRAAATISVAFGCPFDGEVDPETVVEIARTLAMAGPIEIALGDTIGAAVPPQVTNLVKLASEAINPIPVRIHLHNTRNSGIANAWAALEAGVRIFDASMGGIGGCPFAPKATGNISTEDLVWMATRSGYACNLDLAKTEPIREMLEDRLGRKVPSMVAQAGPFPFPS